MNQIKFNLEQFEIKEYKSIIIGSGAAGLNCALHLLEEGINASEIAVITEELGGGTSFNAGSDKQTYYKLSIVGEQLDSPFEMAKDLYSGGAMHGDIALVEASNSAREFFHLVQLGIPFPHDKLGGFVGYKTDNDPKQRATSIGPLTSRIMCNYLLEAVRNQNITIFDKHYAFHILKDNINKRSEAVGLFCIKLDDLSSEKDIYNIINSIKIFQAQNIIIATGGPAILYKNSAYPESQRGSIGLAITAGCKLQNLTESQFGLASIDFRWNVSGSYMQVIPRFVSVDSNGNQVEFLRKYFPSFQLLSKAIFLKGYQWPFNVERIENYGSSLIDLAVYFEIEVLGNNVFLDFTCNPTEYNEKDLDSTAKNYLSNSNALAETPIERLKRLNPNAIKIYKDHNIDINKDFLQIAVCNQHLNGGVTGDIWWETNVKHLFAIGEINGSHGIHRPGGAALNSGQVGGLRAAQIIGKRYKDIKSIDRTTFLNLAKNELEVLIHDFNSVLSKTSKKNIKSLTPNNLLKQIQERMSKYAEIVRPPESLLEESKKVLDQLYNFNSILVLDNNIQIIDFLRIKDALLTQHLFLESILNYHEKKGGSRGSYLILREKLNNSLNEKCIIPPKDLNRFKFIKSSNILSDKIQTIQSQEGIISVEWERVRDIPREDSWFENIWKEFANGKIYE
ncbi:MAG: FAD-binding protein [Candidatus Heimdallarchaeota archaeon]